MKKIILASILSLVSIFAANAQEAKTEYVFNPHWYVQVQPIGGQYTLGEVDFKDLLSWNAQVAVGYQFSKVFGARLGINAWTSKGGWDGTKYGYDVDVIGWKWNYVAPMADLTINLSNALCGYNPTRFFSLSAFVGIGANIAFSNDEAAEAKDAIDAVHTNALAAQGYTNIEITENMSYLWEGTKVRLAGHAGLIGNFRINDKWSIDAELQAAIVGDRYNSKKSDNADWYVNGLIGVKYAFGKTYTKKTVEPVVRVVEKIVEVPVEKIVEKIVEKKVETPVREELRRDIFFTISNTKIAASEQSKVDDVVAYLNKYADAKVSVTGYADKGTGNAAINDRLAAGRAQVVVDALVKAGVSESRIVVESYGDKVQPYAENEKNRVTICIAK